MFDVGFWELALLAVIGLIVLGPERLPVVARKLGFWAGRARMYMRSLSTELEREVNTAELRRNLDSARHAVEDSGRKLESEIGGDGSGADGRRGDRAQPETAEDDAEDDRGHRPE